MPTSTALPRRTTTAALLSALVGLALVGSAPVAPAGAAVSPYVLEVESPGSLPDGWGATNVCTPAPGGDDQQLLTFVEEASAGHTGRGALQVQNVPDSSEPGGFSVVSLPASSSIIQLAGLSAAYQHVAGWAPAMQIALLDPARPDVRIRVIAQGATDPGWTTLDLYSATDLVVLETDGSNATTQTSAVNFATYRATRTSYWVVAADLLVPCSVPTTVRWDDVRITLGSIQTHYDLEPSVPVTLTSAVSATAVAYGGAVSVTGSIARTADSSPVAGAQVELWRKPAGSADFAYAATATSGAGGALVASVRPTTATQYRWQVPSSSYAGSASTARSVSVRAALTLNRVAASVTYPAPVVLFGAAKPLPAGTTVTLRRSGSSTALATASVRADGTFAFAKRLARGSYTFTVSVPAVAGYAAATSAKVSVTVS